MKKLMKMFKSMPKELKAVIAMAGAGSTFGAIMLLRRFMFPKTPLIYLIFGLLVVVGVICLLGFLISKVLGRGKRKRSKKMAEDLAGDGGGQVSMDVAASIKSNNEKFFVAIKDMRKNLHVDIYDLPWYIVIGDAGCGKTKLINAGGLQFSAGKPEGYTLGTLNYNWWFTEDAIFIDMAGRLVNPRDDSDRREWDAFLNTIAKGRKGFPINGALICVDAYHLLAEPPEKIEQDANTMLERLRDLQNKLGVTFACYLVITKCDKIVGFMQFFDRAGRDITVLNQMVGWSKPGEFNELYDPEDFPKDFNRVYHRLHELRLRRLQDDVEEQDLGLAYGFPEEFREIMHPLQTYVRTLFPKIKNPRAMKNLIFRGTYFTSATQEGSLILKHLQERLGAEAAEQFAPLDLYPTKRTYFIKDLLFRKVFPEHGLVFRNEHDVVRNRRLAKFLKVGSVVMGAVLIAFVVMSSRQFGAVIGEPRAAAQEPYPWQPPAEKQVLELSEKLDDGVSTLRGHRFWAKLLSLGIGSNKPIVNLKTIQAAVFEEALKEALRDISASLRNPAFAGKSIGRAEAEQYLGAVTQYVRWYGCGADDVSWGGHIDKDSLSKMCNVVHAGAAPNSVVVSSRESFDKHAAIYFANASAHGDWLSPARLLIDEETEADPEGTIARAMSNVRTIMRQYATLNANHPHPVIREWMRICASCRTVDTSYHDLLEAGGQVLEDVNIEALQEFQKTFGKSYASFDTSLQGCLWASEEANMLGLREAIYEQREEWVGFRARMLEELVACGAAIEDHSDVVASLNSVVETGASTVDSGLDQILWKNLYAAKIADQEEYKEEYFESLEAFKKVTTELYEPYRHIVQLHQDSENAVPRLTLAPPTFPVTKALAEINESLKNINLVAADPPGVIVDWTDSLEEIYNAAGGEESGRQTQLLSLEDIADEWQVAWRTTDLAELYADHRNLIALGQGTAALRTVRDALESIDTGALWGLATIYPDYGAARGSAYFIPLPVSEGRRETTTRSTRTPKAQRRRGRRFQRGGRRGVGGSAAPAPARTNPVVTGESNVPKCASQHFLSDLSDQSADLLDLLDLFGKERLYLPDTNETTPLHEQCSRKFEDAMRVYMEQYVSAWSEAYEKHKLRSLDDLTRDAHDWESLVSRLSDRARGGHSAIAIEIDQALNEILNSITFWGWFRSEAGTWHPPNAGANDYQLRVAGWMRKAINDRWRASLDGAEFPGQTTKPPDAVLESAPRGAAPSQAIAAEVVARFSALAEQLSANRELLEEFEGEPDDRDLAKRRIPWNSLKEISKDAKLEGETFTGRLLDLEETAQQFLNEKLTNTLHGIQARYFPDADPWKWPYLDDPNGSGSEKEVLDTVDFASFRKFLKEIAWAKAYFVPLEEGFPNSDPQYKKRQTFYRQCAAWYDFLGLKRSSNRKLKIERIEWFDPESERGRKLTRGVAMHDTAQNMYLQTELELGVLVRFPGDSGFTDKPIRVSTRPLGENETSAEAQWNWPNSSGTDDMVFKLLDGRRPGELKESFQSVKHSFGSTSALALCGYLETGISLDGDRRKWAKVHVIDLAGALKGKGRLKHAKYLRDRYKAEKVMIGLGYKFTLERPMPEAIVPMERAKSSASARR